MIKKKNTKNNNKYFDDRDTECEDCGGNKWKTIKKNISYQCRKCGALITRGDRVYREKEYMSWCTLGGQKHKGFIKEIDNNVLVIDCEICKKECCYES